MTEETKKSRYSFDLSDGFGKEDIKAIFSGIWHFIVGILKIIFWPYVWISRIIGRSIRFIRVKATDNPLNKDERAFMESIPGFFIITGIFSAIFLIAIGYIINENIMKLGDFFRNIDISSLLESLWNIFFATYPDISVLEIILLIIGYDVRDSSGAVIHDRFGILDILGYIFDFVASIIQDPLMLFIGIVVVMFVLVIIFIVISETGIVGGIVSIFAKIFGVLKTTPRKGFNKINSVYLRFNSVISGVIIGDSRLEGYSVSFHKKLLLYIYLLGVLTFLAGFIVILFGKISEDQIYSFILIILLVVGFGVGVLEMFVIVRFIDFISRGRYSTERIKEQSRVS
ncbi:MAG: hypothetical protein ACFFFH_12720 [Candidatus Thorarchaeota archaeon]